MKTTATGYRIDNKIFIGIFLFIVLLSLYVMWQHDFDFSTQFYFKCEKDLCENPLYELTDCKQRLTILFFIPLYTAEDCRSNCVESWCHNEFVPRGEYGKNPKDDMLFASMYYIMFGLILLGLVLNHLLYNRGKKIDLGIIEFWRAEIQKIKEWKISKKIMETIDDEQDNDNRKN